MSHIEARLPNDASLLKQDRDRSAVVSTQTHAEALRASLAGKIAADASTVAVVQALGGKFAEMFTNQPDVYSARPALADLDLDIVPEHTLVNNDQKLADSSDLGNEQRRLELQNAGSQQVEQQVEQQPQPTVTMPEGYTWAGTYSTIVVDGVANKRDLPQAYSNAQEKVAEGTYLGVQVTGMEAGSTAPDIDTRYRWYYIPEGNFWIAATNAVTATPTSEQVTPSAVSTPKDQTTAAPTEEPPGTEFPPQAGTGVPPAGPELPTGPALPPTGEVIVTPDSGVVAQFSLQEVLALPENELGLPREAFLHPEPNVFPVRNQLPTHVFNIVNGQAVPVAVNNPTFTRLASGEFTMTVPGFNGGEIVWMPVSGWAVEQFSTSSTRVLLDTGYAFSDNRERFSGRKDYLYGVAPFSRNILSGADANYQADRDYTETYSNIFQTPTPNVLLKENPGTFGLSEIVSPMDAQTITAFVYLEKAGNITEQDVLETAIRYYQTNEPMVVQTPVGEWNLRAGLNLVFAPIVELGNNDRTPTTQFGYDYAHIEQNGSLTITHTGRGVDSWGASVTIPSAIALMTNTSRDEFSTPEQSILHRAGIILRENGNVDMAILPIGGAQNSGGSVNVVIR